MSVAPGSETLWDPLLTPAVVAGLALQNRFALAPLTRMQSPGGVPTRRVADYYQRRASQLGLIITEGTYVDEPSAGRSPNVPRLDSPQALAGWRTVVDAVHQEGAKIFPQLWHVGGMRQLGDGPFTDAPVLTPSGVNLSGEPVGVPATAQQIDQVVDAFARGAVAAQEQGFDGVEIHGANGYLIDQFLWEGTNRRTDGYGGSIANRTRLGAQVVAEIRRRVGADFPIQFRFGQWKVDHYDARIASTPQQLEQVLWPLVEAGVDIFHPSTRRFWQPAFPGSDLTLSGWTKKLTGKPSISVGYVGVDREYRTGDLEPPVDYDPQLLLELYRRGDFDIVAIGRALLADPEWVRKTVSGRTADVTRYTKAAEDIYY